MIGVLTQSELYEKTISNMVECKSRGAYLMGLTTYGNYNIEDNASFTVYVPKTEECFATSLAVIPLQLMGYYVSVARERVRIVRRFRLAGARRKSVYEISYIINYFDAFM